MIPLILFESLIYSANLSVRKNYILPKISTHLYILCSAIITLCLFALLSIIKPDIIAVSKKDVVSIKQIFPIMIGSSLTSYMIGYIWVELIRTTNLSQLVTINNVFITIFTGMIGYLFFKQKFTKINILGMIVGLIGVYMMRI